MRQNITLLVGAMLAICSGAHAAPLSPATHALQITDIGANAYPISINNVGQVVGQLNRHQAFFWSNGLTTPLGTLGGSDSSAQDINDGGVVVGWSFDALGGKRAFRWSNGTMTSLDNTPNLNSSANAINNKGQIVGWAGGIVSAIWDAANPAGKVLFPRSASWALDINENGEIVGQTSPPSAEGYYWNGIGPDSAFTTKLPAHYIPGGINNNGLTAGQNLSLQMGESIFHVIGPAGAHAAGINDLGQIVGFTISGSGFIYETSSDLYFDINLFPRLTPDFGKITRLTELNEGGTFVGTVLVDGVEHGFVGQLVEVPEPSTVVIAAVGLLALAGVAVRRLRLRDL